MLLQWKRYSCIRCATLLNKEFKGLHKTLVRVTDESQIPYHVSEQINHAGLNLLELCPTCEPQFRGKLCLCAVCGKPAGKNSQKTRQVPPSFTFSHLRRDGAKCDMIHSSCKLTAMRWFEQEQGKNVRTKTEEAEPEPPLTCEVDIGRDKKTALSDNEKKMFGFFLSCQRHQNQITFTMVGTGSQCPRMLLNTSLPLLVP